MVMCPGVRVLKAHHWTMLLSIELDEDLDGIWKDAKIRTAFSSFLSF